MPNRGQANSFFRSGPGTEFTIKGLTSELNTAYSDLDIDDNQLSGGQNMIPGSRSSMKKRGGSTLYGNFMGTSTGVLGGFNYVNAAGTQEQLAVYNTVVHRYVAGTWTALTGVTMTTNKPADGVYFPFTDKFYVVNDTDNVVIYTSGTSADQTNSTFKKLKYIEHFQNRLIGIKGDIVWYTDAQAITFGANNFYQLESAGTGIKALNDMVIHFTKRKVQRLMNFTFDGTTSWADKLYTLPAEFGTIYDRTISVVNNLIYFVGQDTHKKAKIYVTDGYTVRSISDDKIDATLEGLSASQLENACSVPDGLTYRLHVAEAGQTTNNIGIIYDTHNQIFYPVERRWIAGRADFSCLWTSETSGVWDVYAGTQGTGQVYKLHANDGLYDELGEERYLTSGSYNVPIDGSPAKRAAQSFKMSQYNVTQTVPVTQVAVQLKKNAGTTTALTVRIETDNNGKPSGTLVSAGATTTIAAITSTSYAWYNASFSSAINLNGNTSYWLVLQHSTEGSGNSQYHWLGDSCSATYTNGNLATYVTAAASVDTFNSSASAVSGIVGRYSLNQELTSETLSVLRSGSGTYATMGYIQTALATEDYTPFNELQRGIILFDTSSLPNDATITSATVSLYASSKTNGYSQSVGLTSVLTASNSSLTESDYALANFGSTRFCTDVSINSITLNTYNSFALNASGISNISLTGVSKFAIRLSADIDNTSPTAVVGTLSFARFQGYVDTNKPRLVVTYTSASGTATWTSDTVTDQTFIIYAQSPIDAYGDGKAHLLNNGKEFSLHQFQTIFSTVGNYNVEVGFASSEFGSYTTYLVDLSADGGAVWGNFSWGDGTVWGGTQTRNYDWTIVNGLVGRTIKQRVRNRNANQQFEYNRTNLVVTPRLRQA